MRPDAALATKLAIDSGREGEQEMLEAGRPSMRVGRSRATAGEKHATRLERELAAY